MRKNRNNKNKELTDTNTGYENSVNNAYEKENKHRFRKIVFTICFIMGIIIVSCVASLVKNAWEINNYFGFAVLVILSLLCLFYIVIPLIKILAIKPMQIKVDENMVPKANKANMAVLKKSATNLVVYHSDKKNIPYISDERIEKLRQAIKGTSDELTGIMGDLYRNELSSKTAEIIRTSAMRSFVSTAVSQSDRIDFLSSVFINVSLTKQIVFTYGFRPTNASLFKIFISAVRNSAAAFCMENMNIFSGMTNKFLKGVAEKIPFINVIVDSTCQGAANSLLTSLLGRKVRRILIGEYKGAVDLNENSLDDDIEDAIEEIKEIKNETAA